MTKTGHVWKEIEDKIGANDVLASAIRGWFKNIVDGTKAYDQAQERTNKGLPRLRNLPLNTQRELKADVRKQYPELPVDKDAEALIEKAFDIVFKGKHQWEKEKEKAGK